MNKLPDRLQHLMPFVSRKLPQYVYVVRCNDFIKVGIADNPKARVQYMQTGNPYKLELLKVMRSKNPKADEESIHEALGKRWIRGEWFKLDGGLKALLGLWFKD